MVRYLCIKPKATCPVLAPLSFPYPGVFPNMEDEVKSWRSNSIKSRAREEQVLNLE